LPNWLSSGAMAFDFLDTPDTAFLLTRHPSYNGVLLGDMSDKSIAVGLNTVVTPGTEFTYYGAPHLCTEPADVRLYFETEHHGPLFDETDYWWSAGAPDLGSFGFLVLVVPTSPLGWIDAKGHSGSSDAAHELAFTEAVRNVKAFGLSFGGGCGFGNGVGISAATGEGYFATPGFGVSSATP